MNLPDILRIYAFEGKAKGDAAVQEMLSKMTAEERKQMVAGICNGVNDMAKQFTVAAVEHAVNTDHPFSHKSKQDADAVIAGIMAKG